MTDGAFVISTNGMRAKEVQALRRVLCRTLRNVEIRARYREMLPGEGSEGAILHLADAYGLSETQIRNILYARR